MELSSVISPVGEDWDSDQPWGAWSFKLYPGAAEGVAILQCRGGDPAAAGSGVWGRPDDAARVAARRAGTKVRRYCAANRLNRLGTLTYRGAGCHDVVQLHGELAARPGNRWRRKGLM